MNQKQPTLTSAKSVDAKKDKPPTPQRSAASTRQKKLVQDLAGLYASIGMLVASADTYTGVLLMQHAEKRATELVDVAKHHPEMMKWLERLTTSNDYITCIIGHGIMTYAILAHFGRVPNAPIIAAMGMSEAQVLAPPPQAMEQPLNGYASVTS